MGAGNRPEGAPTLKKIRTYLAVGASSVSLSVLMLGAAPTSATTLTIPFGAVGSDVSWPQ